MSQAVHFWVQPTDHTVFEPRLYGLLLMGGLDNKEGVNGYKGQRPDSNQKDACTAPPESFLKSFLFVSGMQKSTSDLVLRE
jgi:hypothetical protein